MMNVRNFRKSHVAVTPKRDSGRGAMQEARLGEGSHFRPWVAM